jgi:GNAT superfamily N-acetyltransferase
VSFKLKSLGDIAIFEPVDLLNMEQLREHLMPHSEFDVISAQAWRSEKIAEDQKTHSFVKAVLVEGQLAGWCGIQKDNQYYELAIVLAPQYWGLGKRLFENLLLEARAMGHSELQIHFLHTRRPYRFMEKMALQTFDTEINGNQFRSYVISTGLANDHS